MTELYLKQAVANEQLAYLFLNTLWGKCYSNWFFVVAYYCCLHYLYAFLSAKKQNIPTTHKDYFDKNGREVRGAVSIGQNDFYTSDIESGISTSSGPEFGQLFEWSTIARYRPERYSLLTDNLADEVFGIIKNCKVIAFNETKQYCEASPKNRVVKCEELTKDLIPKLHLFLDEIK